MNKSLIATLLLSGLLTGCASSDRSSSSNSVSFGLYDTGGSSSSASNTATASAPLTKPAYQERVEAEKTGS
ncbi:MAG: hypothetical protein QUS14_04505, partial [Pyrinomonadaceae bacterium]|nr:hypothetical protein [Pyrinomonadaceae bacterium]